jgi:hypothetical protein
MIITLASACRMTIQIISRSVQPSPPSLRRHRRHPRQCLGEFYPSHISLHSTYPRRSNHCEVAFVSSSLAEEVKNIVRKMQLCDTKETNSSKK